jgi:uncharacterized YigZ family protein
MDRFRDGISSEDGQEPDSYRTLASLATAELKVQRSRFLAEVAPAPTEAAARAVVDRMTRKYHDCRHICYAWRGGTGSQLRELRHDGGEPAGTAGNPLLMALRQAGVTDAVAVVARYFGGIKLGTGGLARAYGDVATLALASAEQRTVVRGRESRLCFAYSWQKPLASLLGRHGGTILEELYADRVTWRIWLPASAIEAFTTDLQEVTAGVVKMEAPT